MTETSDTSNFRAPGAVPKGRVRVDGAWLREAALALAVIAGIAGAAQYGYDYWTTGRFLITTDDAYVDAHSALIAPKVSGYNLQVPVNDNQKVKAGQVIARIDPRDYQTALAEARANVAAAEASIATLSQQVAQQNYQRYMALARTGYGTVQQAQQSSANIREKTAALARDTTGIGVAKKQVAVYQAQLAQAHATLAQQRATEHQAKLNLGYTTITAPFDGTVGVRTVTVGQYVQPGTQLMAVVPLHAVYVTANYMETQLTHVRAGQPVTIDVDTFPGVIVHGHVDSLSPASGQQFALLPPDNATGNFTKIVQRIPVKIAIDQNDPLAGRLRPGMSVEPTINTKPAG